jgi:O-antigen ligase
MPINRNTQDRILLLVAITAAALIHISIAASQVFLGLGAILLLIVYRKWQFPRIWVPLAALFFWTVLADALSVDPWLGRTQIRKFFVFLFIPLIYTVFIRQFTKVFDLMAAWTAVATASAIWALVQYFIKFRHASYESYVGERITGFESHWMTFGALQLSVLSLLLAQWFFSNRKMPVWAYSSVVVISAAILLNGTRSIWLAAALAVLYLVWCWRPRMTLLVPVIGAGTFLVAPATTRQRMLSIVHPDPNIDSNRHRAATFWTGVEMIKAHPWFGLGPEEIARNFNAYVPAKIRRPLPVGYYGHLHNIYVQYAAERGIPGLLCVLWFIGLVLWDSIRGILRLRGAHSQELFVLHGTVAVIIGILAGGIFEYNLGDSEVLMMFNCVIALSYAAGKSATAETVSK